MRLKAYTFGGNVNTRLVECFAQGIGRVVQSQALHFPDNIFGDLDFLAADLLAQARSREEDALTYLERAFDLIVELNGVYGIHSPIRFCYAHDFIHGFDWSRWVRRQPLERRAYSPFSLEFLAYLKHRGGELLELIHRDDAKYPALPAGQLRNVFPFSREPDDEIRLHQALARDHLIPVPAWDANAAPHWDFDCNKTRRLRAADLKIAAASKSPELTPPHGEG